MTGDGDSISERGNNHIVSKRQEYGAAVEDEKVQVLELKRNGHQLGHVGPSGSSTDGSLA